MRILPILDHFLKTFEIMVNQERRTFYVDKERTGVYIMSTKKI